MSEDKAEVVEDTGPRMATRVNNMNDDATVTVLAEGNPKREGSNAHAKFERYIALALLGAFTVAEYIKDGQSKLDLKYDFTHGFIDIDGAEVEEYEVTPRGEKAEATDETESDDEPALEESEDAASGF